MTVKIDKKGGNWIKLHQSEMCGKASIITWRSIWHHMNMNNWTRRCIQCAIRSPFANVTLKNHVTMEFYWSLWMMRDSHTYTGQFPMLQSQKVDKERNISSLRLIMIHGQNISTDRVYQCRVVKIGTNKKHHNLLNSTEGLAWNTSRIIWCKRKGQFSMTCHYEYIMNIIYWYYKVKREKECHDSFDYESNGCLYQRWWEIQATNI